jgi:hypothetical protein
MSVLLGEAPERSLMTPILTPSWPDQALGSIAGPGSLRISEPQEGPMAEEPTARTSLDARDLESLSDEELQRLTQLLMSERERRMGLEPGPEDPV